MTHLAFGTNKAGVAATITELPGDRAIQIHVGDHAGMSTGGNPLLYPTDTET